MRRNRSGRECQIQRSDDVLAVFFFYNFVWPDPSPEQYRSIEIAAQEILEARANHPDSTLAEMYDPNNEIIYLDLIDAHRKLDAAVEAAYGVDFDGDEEKMVAHLFKLYSKAVQDLDAH